jgi:hypothetical protein
MGLVILRIAGSVDYVERPAMGRSGRVTSRRTAKGI